MKRMVKYTLIAVPSAALMVGLGVAGVAEWRLGLVPSSILPWIWGVHWRAANVFHALPQEQAGFVQNLGTVAA